MDEERFEEQYGQVLRLLRNRRGACPDMDSLIAYYENRAGAEARARLREHLTLCGLCQEMLERLDCEPAVLDEVTWRRAEQRLERRPSPWKQRQRPAWVFAWGWRRFGAIAALVMIALAGVIWIGIEPQSVRAPVSEVRGPAIQIVQPAGVVDELRRFDWTAPPLEARFHLQIGRGNRIIWEATTAETTYVPPAELRAILRPGTVYRWKVQALDAQGTSLAESDWIDFQKSR